MWSKSSPCRNALAIGLTAMIALVFAPQFVWPSQRWENHLDASSIMEIVYRDGMLIMATNGGLLVYDLGDEEFTQYDNTSGLPSNALACLVFDGSGALWVGMEDIGIAKVDLTATGLRILKTFNEEFDGLSGNDVRSIAIWNGEVVYGTETGAGLFEKEIPAERFFKRDGLPSDVVNDIMPDGGFVWIATDSGAVVLDLFGFLVPPPGAPPTSFAVEKSPDAVWLGTENGAWTMDLGDSSWTQVGLANENVFALHWDGQSMWVGGKSKFYEYDGASWTEHSLNALFRDYYINAGFAEMASIASTPGGDLYLGGWRPSAVRGINLVMFDGTISNLRPNTPGGNMMIRLSRDVDGSVWMSASNFGVGKLTPAGKWVNYNTSIPAGDSLSNPIWNTALLADVDGYKWFSTLTADPGRPKLLDRLDDKLDDDYTNDQWQHYDLGSGGGDTYSTLRPQRAVLDPAGNRWFLSDDVDWTGIPDNWRGINILSRDQSEWLVVSPDSVPDMKSGNVTHVAFGTGVVYLALGEYGVQSWNIGGGYGWASLSDFSTDRWGLELDAQFGVDMVRDGFATSVALRSDGVVWIGSTMGVIKYTPSTGRFTRIEQNQGFGVGLLSPTVSYVLLDHDENLWVATSLGLNRISRENDNDIEAFSTTAAYQTILFKLQYPFSIVTPLANADCRELLLHPEEDLLYIATGGGLSILDISPVRVEDIDLSSVYVYPNPIDASKGHNSLFLGVTAATGKVSIEIYNLEGELVHSKIDCVPGEEIWDLTTNDNFIAASGVYFVRINNKSKSVVKPISVVR